MSIVIAADHAGFEVKEHIKGYLEGKGYIIEDVGAFSFDPNDDYPLYIKRAAELVVRVNDAVGVIFGGSGQGEAITANRFRGVRAIVYAAPDPELIRVGREHNNANMLSIGARFLTNEQVEEAVDVFLSVPFPGDERHMRRITQIDN